MIPNRIHLRTKRSKRCKDCSHQLIKPEQKTQNTHFKIKDMARDHVPHVTLLYIDDGKNVLVNFCNPLEFDLDIEVAGTGDDVK